MQTEDCTFTGNYARVGGAIKFNSYIPNHTNAEFAGNGAEFGPNSASYPATLRLVDNTSLDRLVSGQVAHELVFDLLDAEGEIISNDHSSTLSITALDGQVN